ncbi:restriction endonuclease subunit S [Olleya aquimaris]|uniref:Type I restriction enzyme S subunit n=1 Tax=Olleya aquimaris TaxID=639310 RepID=A0A327RLE5_9FLAO|nr:restriction endonuclease subunit S [Olleya aquimaris]RAJ17830.1 type I restriction enzyme S subunit [Olleya aquimaris]
MELVELGNLATFSQGQQVSIKDQSKDYFEGSDIFLRIINYTQNSTDFRYIPKQNPKYLVSKDDIIMVRYGAVGFVGRGFTGVLANNMFKINYNEELLNSDFLYRILRSELIQNQILNSSQKTSMPAINFKTISRVKIPLPPLATQKKIAAILDEADTLRQLNKDLIAKYDALTQSLFLEMFVKEKKFEQVELIELVNKITDGTHHTPTYTDSGIPFLRVTDITKSNDSKKFISKEEHEVLIKRCNPEKEDILYTKNGTIGVAKIVDWDYEFSVFVSLCLIKPKHEKINNKFLETFLNTPYALNQAKKHSKTGTITNLHLIEIKKMKIPLPPINLQNQFAERVALIEQQKAQAQQSLQKTEDLFNSLLQKAFKGELVK